MVKKSEETKAYFVISESTLIDLMKTVDAFRESGYEPIGGIAFDSYFNKYMQAMKK